MINISTHFLHYYLTQNVTIGPVNPELALLAVCCVLVYDYMERADHVLAEVSFNLTFQPGGRESYPKLTNKYCIIWAKSHCYFWLWIYSVANIVSKRLLVPPRAFSCSLVFAITKRTNNVLILNLTGFWALIYVDNRVNKRESAHVQPFSFCFLGMNRLYMGW